MQRTRQSPVRWLPRAVACSESDSRRYVHWPLGDERGQFAADNLSSRQEAQPDEHRAWRPLCGPYKREKNASPTGQPLSTNAFLETQNPIFEGFRRSAMDTVTRADKKSKKHNGVDATAETGVDEAKVSCGLFWRLCFLDDENSSRGTDCVLQKERKRKKKEQAAEEEGDEQPVTKSKKDKKAKPAAEAQEPPSDPNALANFALSERIKAKLQENGVNALFPIQAATFSKVMDGKDIVGRARTGQGKTLAFVLPILESLARAASSKPAHGRHPSVIVLAPTRELANQVHADFQKYGAVLNLATVCVYGGAPMPPQEAALRRGVDVVVGTPGRVKDFLERGTLGLGALRFRVLDEADEMLNMGFVEDVEYILSNGCKPAGDKPIQTLLFSATLPSWVADVAQRFLKPDRETVDLVGTSTLKAAESVRHLLMHCNWTERTALIADTIRARAPAIVGDDGGASAGRVIVFCETKRDTQEVAESLQAALATHGARALHGDIPQATREKTLAEFRAARFAVLVATDVAARGLDISGVALVVQAEPPRDPETYIHRSGRTGRAGATGVCVTFCTPRHADTIASIERRAGLKFERVGAPQQADLAAAAAIAAAAAVRAVARDAALLFRDAATELLAGEGATAVDVLAAALAKIAGHTSVVSRSLLSSHSGMTTLMFRSPIALQSPSYVWSYLRARITGGDAAVLDEIKRMTVVADGRGAVFDVPAEHATLFLECTSKGPAFPKGCTIETCKQLPDLPQATHMQSPGGPRGSGRGGYAPGRGGYGGGGGRFGRSSFGRGGGRQAGGRWRS